MKVLNAIVKILTALAAVAGAVYIVATYGEQIVAWAKKTLAALPKCPCCCGDTTPAEEAPAAAEETPAEEAPAAEAAPVEEVPEEPAPEVVVSENEPVADDADFAE